ncbi:MAG: helix-turn-helix domain-containing protein [Verrucomicrobia bacterium]|nr:helix-turn-helix domain-containing protein [Verrucomicrobiota bacterium]MCG2679095.1 helix-turn-helix domain-containing protein [Kiritimatiellia bacterium]MBU4248429.1 helix-turn-helix domain-containing protein [Verrucomicrobiota bacterium]MBU4290917.1 helix-turn-helix domain-containing protein [Verrucomicrobiota bacterium]MBU4428038.1 helix-turn-helix domain-containing protein [Verrucomicrobiota bacterium]
MNSLPAQPNQSLIDGVRLLQRLAITQEPLAVTLLARELGLEITRTNRLVKTLAHLGLAYRTQSRKYAAGPAMHVLAAQSLFGSGLIQRALPHLEKLSSQGHIVALGVLWEDQISYLYHWSPGLPTYAGLGRVAVCPAERSGMGIILLAQNSDEALASILRRHRSANNSSYRKLMINIRRARKTGYGEFMAGNSRSLALALGTPPYAALALSGRIRSSKVAQKVAILSQTKAAIEEVMNK